MKKCVIVGNAVINNYELINKYLKDEYFYVYCDGGLKHLEKINKKPDLIVGDFDSHDNPHMDVETIELPCEKDDTDTCHALKVCIGKGFSDFLLIGCIGERLDHTLGNLSLLVMLNDLGLKGVILDDYSQMEIVPKEGTEIDNSFSYFSLISLSDRAENITIRNAKYPLENAVIESRYQYGISNEVKTGCTKAFVSCEKGNLALIKVF